MMFNYKDADRTRTASLTATDAVLEACASESDLGRIIAELIVALYARGLLSNADLARMLAHRFNPAN